MMTWLAKPLPKFSPQFAPPHCVQRSKKPSWLLITVPAATETTS
jgi:hypothetical protein